MKKLFKLFYSLLIFTLLISSTSALDSWTWTTNTWSNSASWITSESVIENTTYTYYYWQGCWYCANVDKYMNAVDGYEKLDIEKKEIYYNDQNREDMLADAQKLWLDPSSIWVPFLIINSQENSEALTWDKPVISYFENILWPAPENNNAAIILAILWVLAVLLPVFLIKLSNKN